MDRTDPAEPSAVKRWTGRGTDASVSSWTLPIVLAGTFMTILDFFIVNVALPDIQHDLHASGATIQLIVAGYGLTLATGLITGGRLGDMYGRRRMFVLGLELFAATSAGCGLAPTAGVLVAARLAQGAAAALLTPQTLAVINTSFAGPARARAFAGYGLTLGAAAVFGQVIGGLLIRADVAGTGWRSVFLVNVPVGLAALLAARRGVPESRGPQGTGLDVAGAGLITVALAALVVPLALGRQQGWPGWAELSLAASPVLLGVFAAYERRLVRAGGSPVIDVTALSDRAFTAGLAVALTFCLGQASFFLALSLYLQQGRGMTPLGSGLMTAVVGAGFFAALVSGQVLARSWGRQALAAGAAEVALGYLVLSVAVRHVGVAGSLWWLVPGLLVAGFGMGLVLSPIAETVLARVHPEHAASASGVLNTALQVGGAIGVAAVGSVYLSRAGTAGASNGLAFQASLEVMALCAASAALVVQAIPPRPAPAPPASVLEMHTASV